MKLLIVHQKLILFLLPLSACLSFFEESPHKLLGILVGILIIQNKDILFQFALTAAYFSVF